MKIRKGGKDDLPVIFKLIRELAEYERATHEVITSVESMEEDGFGENPVFGFHVAENNTGIVGLALYYYRYSTWKGKLLFLEDLVVTEPYRNKGIGRLLMDAVFREARDQKCRGIQWQVLEWNEPAISFYRKYDPEFDPEWINCKIIFR